MFLFVGRQHDMCQEHQGSEWIFKKDHDVSHVQNPVDIPLY